MRPLPPERLFEDVVDLTIPDPELMLWAHSTFVDEDGSLNNEDHQHLRFARVGFLWTNVANGRHGKRVVGQCELGTPRAMGKWPKARAELQLYGWFGFIPDFLITLDALYARRCGDAEFCALVEHELYHAGQERLPDGSPKFRRDGRPAFAMRGHDVEEFVGIVRRYGVGAAAGDTFALVEAAKSTPTIASATISQACGTCLKVHA